MPRLWLCSLVLGLLLAAAPATAAGEPPPPPIDWSDFIDSLGGTPKDAVVGEEMC
ncbi:MAG: hypothetical protein VCD50_00595 [Alphaproteobacteria bacterium]